MRRFVVFPLVLALLASACSRDPETLKRQYVQEGDRHVAEKKPREAIVAYRNAVQQDERYGEARAKLAAVYQEVGDYSGALREAVRAADLLPKDIDAQLRAGRLLLGSGQREDAKTRATAALALDPKNVDALILLGNAMASLKDLDGAITQVEAAIEQDPKRTLSYANLGLLQIAKGDRDAAEAAFKRAVEVQPESADAHLSLGNYYWAASRFDEAERELKVALQKDPASEVVNRSLAAFYVARNRPAEAEQHLKLLADRSSEPGPKLVLADFYAGNGKSDAATKILEPLAGREDAYVAAGVRLATIEYRSGRQSDAYRRLDEMLKKEPDSEPVALAKIRLLMADRKFADAQKIAGAVVERNDKSVSGHYYRGLALQGAGSFTEASREFETVLRLAPTFVAGKMALAELHISRGEPRRALALSTEVIKSDPQSVASHLLHAKALLRSGDLRNGERELRLVASAMPASSDVNAWLGLLHENKREWPAARQAYEKALGLDAENQMAFAGLVNTDLAERKPDAARTRLESKLASSPNDPAVLLLAGLTYSRLNDLARAEVVYKKLLEVNPDSLDAYGGLAGLYVAQNRLDEARGVFEAVAKQQEKPIVANTMIGMILTLQNKHQEARKYYEEALAMNPRAAVAANNLAWDYAEHGGNLNVALQLAQTAKSQLPEHPQVNDTLGWVYYKNNLFGQAVGALGEAAQKSPSNARIQYRLGLAQMKNGNLNEARRAFQQVIKLDPQFAQTEKVPQLLSTLG